MFQRNFKLYDFPLHSVCFIQNFFRSEQKFPSILYHCAKFKKFYRQLSELFLIKI